MATAYRIHRRSEPLDTLLNPRRPDGWVVGDETLETQPLGVSCCLSEDDLRRYIGLYGLNMADSLLVELEGEWSPEGDADECAHRMIVSSYRVLGDAAEWFRGEDEDDDDEAASEATDEQIQALQAARPELRELCDRALTGDHIARVMLADY